MQIIFLNYQILKVSNLYQLNLEKFVYKCNANILHSSFDNFFQKCTTHMITRQQVLENVHHKHDRTYYGKK